MATRTLVEIPDLPAGLDELTRTIEARMEHVAAGHERTIAQHQRSTIEPRPPSNDRAHTIDRAEATKLGRVTAGLHLERTLGTGGMGIVRLATQLALHRKVAVKTLRPETLNDVNTLRLLREAWVTGSLEHPNVVPVYDLGLDDTGAPIIVLRRIEGVEWGELMRDPDEVKERFGVTDLLEWNLRILLQVCNAMSLAHARGILHRDLKPENVLIGAFGEVYVVDWGIAVSLRDDSDGRLPLAGNASEMAGTLVYMAPEMLGGHAERISERTDVYLLGAVLYEVLTGAPPHEGENFRQIVYSILTSAVELPTAPPELETICQRAMHADPSQRHASVAELRAALEGFLGHRGSSQLEGEAAERLDELRESIIAAADDPGGDRTHVYNLFGAARFGYLQALRSWPQNDAARSGLHRAVELMVGHELSHGSPEAAAACLADLEAPPPDLVAKVDAALAEHKKERARLDQLSQLGAAMDYSVGRRTRLTLAVALSALWIGTPLAAEYWMHHGGAITHNYLTMVTLALMVAALLLGWWGRESMNKTAINRRLAGGLAMVFAAQFSLHIGARLAGISAPITLTLQFFSWFVVTGMLALSVDRRLTATAVGYLIAFLVTARWPATRFYMMAAGNAVFMINSVIAWGSLEEAKERITQFKDHVAHLERRSRERKSIKRGR